MVKEDRYFIIIASIAWLSAIAVTYFDFIVLQRLEFRLTILSIIGILLMFTGTTVWIMARLTLAGAYSPFLKTSENQELVTKGIYRHIRHPIYAADILSWLGITLFFSSIYGFLAMLLMIPVLIYRIGIEERMLIRKFGERYIQYRQKTKKLIPHAY